MTRTQLTLLVPPPLGPRLDELRRELDPVQAALIGAHVTLCREDELEGVAPATIGRRLGETAPLELRFGPVASFEGHGLLLPCVDGETAYHALRVHVLAPRPARRSTPHLTLAHPRNPRAAGNDAARVAGLPVPFVVRFALAHLIRQDDGGPWRQLEAFSLGTT